MSDKLKKLNKLVDALPCQRKDLAMEKLLQPVLEALPDLLTGPALKSLYIDYEPPYLMRLSFKAGEEKLIYISCHYFFGEDHQSPKDLGSGLNNPYFVKGATEKPSNLYHPHPWAAAFAILDGAYDQRIGLATERGMDNPPGETKTVRQDAKDPRCDNYAFNDPLIWHEVMPLDNKPVSTVMITFIPEDWNQKGPMPPPDKSLRPLTREEETFMREHFKTLVAQKLAPKAVSAVKRPASKSPKP